MQNFSSSFLRAGVLGAALLVAAHPAAQAQTVKAFTPGNYVVAQIGATGSTTALTSASAPMFLAEYTPAGALVQAVPLPTTDASPNLAITESGSATSDANLTRSADGRFLVLTGYNAPVGTLAVTGTAAATNNRLIARIAADGSINTTTRINDAFDTNNIRAAASADGSAFYAVGGNSGVRYLPLGNAGATTALSTGAPTNLRFVSLAGGNVYVSSASSPTYGVLQAGTGRPTAAGQALALLPGFATAAGPSPYAFFFADLSPAVPGVDVVYVTDDRSTTDGGIQKWSLVGSTWTLNGTIGGNTTAALRGLTGSVSGTSVALVASGNGLFAFTDATGYNVAPTVVLPAALVALPTNTAFRGVALAPVATALATHPEATQTQLALYPNPAQDVLTISLPTGSAGHTAEVRDLLGRTVRTATLPASGQLSLAGLAPGTYLLTVDGSLTRRITKAE